MKDIKKLIEAAHNTDLLQFEKELQKFRMAVSSIGNGSYARSWDEKSLLFVCGSLSPYPNDLRAVANTLWKHLIAEDVFDTKSGWEGIQSDVATVLLASSKEHVWDLIEDFKREMPPTEKYPHAPAVVVNKTLVEWIPNQQWEMGDPQLHSLIQTNQVSTDTLVYKAVQKSNASLLQWLIHNAEPHDKSRFALYTAGNWCQKIIEQQSPAKLQCNFHENHTMFEVIEPFFNLDEFIGVGVVDRYKNGEGPLPMQVDIGAMYWPIQEAYTWDGQSPTKSPATQYRQFNTLLQHIPLPDTTEHMYILRKMQMMCPEELPRLQEWFDHMERVRMLTHVNHPATTAKKKM